MSLNIKDTKIVDVSKSKYKDYYENEISYLRSKKVKEELLRKINNMFYVLNHKEHRDFKFFKNICCDFKLLEEKCKKYEK